MRALEKTRERATREHERVTREHKQATRGHCHECYVQQLFACVHMLSLNRVILIVTYTHLNFVFKQALLAIKLLTPVQSYFKP